MVAKKIALPSNPEHAVGAVTADGAAWYDDEVIRRLGLDEGALEPERERARRRAEEKRDAFLDGRTPPTPPARPVSRWRFRWRRRRPSPNSRRKPTT
ncbi:hypothetical protein DJ69_10840 [Halorubrum persicum]|uniref:Uncharacterized protein n=1 Tax=Halorubrum persicum TaxID=1383844 RepID=A0A2G1WHW2_9EURY|nr:hypothetical protein [Halorubrum persicum]PHQ38582.1 hypothetical protein DJ69_10840 [Halorubrum persicum]